MKRLLLLFSLIAFLAPISHAQIIDFSKNRVYIGKNAEANYNEMKIRHLIYKVNKQALKLDYKAGHISKKEYKEKSKQIILSKGLILSKDTAETSTSETDTTYTDLGALSYLLTYAANYIDTAGIVSSVSSLINSTHVISSSLFAGPAAKLNLFGITSDGITTLVAPGIGYQLSYKPAKFLGQSTTKWSCDALFQLALYATAGIQSKNSTIKFTYGLNPTLGIWDGYICFGYYFSNTTNCPTVGTSLSF